MSETQIIPVFHLGSSTENFGSCTLLLFRQVNTVTSLMSDQFFSKVYYCSQDHFLCHHQKDYCFPYRINWKPMGGGPDSIVATRDIRFMLVFLLSFINIFHYVFVMKTQNNVLYILNVLRAYLPYFDSTSQCKYAGLNPSFRNQCWITVLCHTTNMLLTIFFL